MRPATLLRVMFLEIPTPLLVLSLFWCESADRFVEAVFEFAVTSSAFDTYLEVVI